jgi:hypothetical protein
MQNNLYCNNCGKSGHIFNSCKMPITSIGVIAFRMRNKVPEYLMIRRKDTLGHIDFMRGKYNVNNKHYILNMLNQMTQDEKERMKKEKFDDLWQSVWSNEPNLSPLYKGEESTSRDKFNQLCKGVIIANTEYTLHDLIVESSNFPQWDEPEWGFPKGRRNSHEKDYDCALREFQEETGLNKIVLHNLQKYLQVRIINPTNTNIISCLWKIFRRKKKTDFKKAKSVKWNGKRSRNHWNVFAIIMLKKNN